MAKAVQEKEDDNNSLSEPKKKSPIQEANEIVALNDEETDAGIYQPFKQTTELSENVDSPISKERRAEMSSEGIDSVRAKNLRLENRIIYYENELGQKDQQLAARNEALDNVAEYGVEETENLGEIHEWFLRSDVQWMKQKERRILFKLTNYMMIGIGLIILLLSGSVTAPIIAAIVSSPYILIAIFALLTIDLYIFVTWYRRN